MAARRWKRRVRKRDKTVHAARPAPFFVWRRCALRPGGVTIFIMKKSSASKTNACRILEQMGIAYRTLEYEVDESDLSAEHVAAQVGLPVEQVFKTLVVRGDRNGLAVAVIPGNYELDFKALARLTGDRKVEMIHLKELQPLTGYIRGGCTALGMKKDYPVFVDETIEVWDEVSISAGQRGLQIILAPADYLRATGAVTGEISQEKKA